VQLSTVEILRRSITSGFWVCLQVIQHTMRETRLSVQKVMRKAVMLHGSLHRKNEKASPVLERLSIKCNDLFICRRISKKAE
jgi:hypothetical protein